MRLRKDAHIRTEKMNIQEYYKHEYTSHTIFIFDYLRILFLKYRNPY